MNKYVSSQGFLRRLVISLWACSLIILIGCSLKQAYRKSYNLGQVYVVYAGDEMFHFSRADVQELDKGIEPIKRMLDYDRVRYLGRQNNQLHFEYHREIQNGRTINYRKSLSLKVRPGEQDIPVDLAGFHLHIFQANASRIRFQVVSELSALTEKETEALHLLRRPKQSIIAVDPDQQRWADEANEQQRKNHRTRPGLPY